MTARSCTAGFIIVGARPNAAEALGHDPGVGEFKTALRKNLHVFPVVGQENLLTARDERGQIRHTDYAERIIATAKQIPDLRLIVLDPLSRFNGGDENVAGDSTRLIEVLEYIAQKTGATVLVAHHANKASLAGHGGQQAAARGSSALTDGVRWQMNLSLMTEAEAERYGIPRTARGHYVKVSVPKNNYAPPTPEHWIQRGQGGYLCAVRLIDTKAQGEQDLIAKIISTLSDLARRGIEYSPTRFAEVHAGPDLCGQKRLRQIVERALESGVLATRAPTQPQKNLKRVLCVPGAKEATEAADPDGAAVERQNAGTARAAMNGKAPCRSKTAQKSKRSGAARQKPVAGPKHH